MKKYDAVIAGYFCVDLIPEFKKNGIHANISEVLKPGKLTEIDGLNVTLGGVVANTGLAMARFSKQVCLNAITGDDFVGKIALEWLDKYNIIKGIVVVEGQQTAFGLVIAPPGLDRVFLESPGCSQIFDLSHIDFDAVAKSRLFHFGYPPLLRQFYLDGGRQLQELFATVQNMDAITSLDFSLPDPDSESGKINWLEILKKVLPYTDIFVPSLEEALQIMMPAEYERVLAASQGADIIDMVPTSLVWELGNRLIDYGVRIVLIKSGHRGAYLFAGDISSINEKHGFNLPESWNHCALWCEAYPVESSRIKNASGAGDTSAAAFLTAILNNESAGDSLKYAAIAGRDNLYCFDIFKEIRSWPEMTEELQSAPHETIDLHSVENNVKTVKELL